MAVAVPDLEAQNGAVNATFSSGTITVAAGALLLDWVWGSGTGAGPSTAPTFAGTLSMANSWAQAGTTQSYGPNSPQDFHRVHWNIASGTSGTVTCNQQRQHYQNILISIGSGFDTSNPIAAVYAGTGITASIPDRLSAGNRRIVFWAGTRNNAETPNTGWTELVDADLFSNLRYCAHGDTDTDPGLNNSSVQPFSWIVVEIAEASSGVTSTVAATLPGLEAAATLSEAIPATAAATLPGLTADATGTVANPISATVDAVLPGLEAAATLSESIPSTVAAVLPGLEASAALNHTNEVTAAVAAVLPGLEAAATLSEAIPSTVAAVLPGLEAAANMVSSLETESTVAAVLPGLTASATLSEAIPSTVSAVLPGLEASAAVSEAITSTVAAALPGLTAAATLSESNPATVAAELPGLTAAATLSEGIPSTVAAALPGLTAAVSGLVAVNATAAVSAVLPGLTATVAGTVINPVVLDPDDVQTMASHSFSEEVHEHSFRVYEAEHGFAVKTHVFYRPTV